MRTVTHLWPDRIQVSYLKDHSENYLSVWCPGTFSVWTVSVAHEGLSRHARLLLRCQDAAARGGAGRTAGSGTPGRDSAGRDPTETRRLPPMPSKQPVPTVLST